MEVEAGFDPESKSIAVETFAVRKAAARVSKPSDRNNLFDNFLIGAQTYINFILQTRHIVSLYGSGLLYSNCSVLFLLKTDLNTSTLIGVTYALFNISPEKKLH